MSRVRHLSVAAPAPDTPSAITREEDWQGIHFYGAREALIAAGVAKEEWLPTGAVAYIRKDAVPVRKWIICTKIGRYVWGSYDKQSGQCELKIQRTPAEEAAWKVRHEAEEKARLNRRERGIDADERACLDAERQARQDASDARATATEWLDSFAYRSEAMVSLTLGMMADGRVKRITPEAHQRLIRLAANLHHAMRCAEVYTVGAEPATAAPRALHLVVDNERGSA